MHLNELQQEHHRTQALQTAYQAQEARMEAQKTEITALQAAHQADVAGMTALKSRLASLEQTQQQQLKLLTKLAAYVQASKDRTAAEKAVLARR